jgi:hypothetical protein
MPLSLCPTIDIAQEQITTILAGLRDLRSKKDKNPLWCILVDSLTGSPTDAYSTKVEKEGHDVATFGDMAKSWTGYLRKLSGELLCRPVVFVFVNHKKEGPGSFPGAPPQQNTPGGKGQEYHSSVYLWVKRVNVKGADKGEDQWRRLQLETRKNSMGTEGRKVVVDFRWYYNAHNEQVSTFCWRAADAVFLCERQSDPAVKALCDVRVYDDTYTSQKLGLSKVSAEELGEALWKDQELVKALHEVMHIKKHNVYDGNWKPLI